MFSYVLKTGTKTQNPQDPLMSNTPLQIFAELPIIGGVFLPWSPVAAVAKAAAEGAVRQVCALACVCVHVYRYRSVGG